MCLRSINSVQGARTIPKSLYLFQIEHKCWWRLWNMSSARISTKHKVFHIPVITRTTCDVLNSAGDSGLWAGNGVWWCSTLHSSILADQAEANNTGVDILLGSWQRIINFLTGLLPSRLPGIIVGQYPPHHLLVRQAIWDPSPCSGLENFIKSNAPVTT